MTETFFRCVFVLLAVFGAAEAVRAAAFRILRGTRRKTRWLVLSISGRDERAEERLRGALLRASWIGRGTGVVCVDFGMDPETRRVCEMICSDRPEITLVTPEEFTEFLGAELKI
jgi:hypothetical protein